MFWSSSFWCITNFVYLLFYYFAEAPTGNALPASFLLRNYIYCRGASGKCPAPEILNSAAAAADFEFCYQYFLNTEIQNSIIGRTGVLFFIFNFASYHFL